MSKLWGPPLIKYDLAQRNLSDRIDVLTLTSFLHRLSGLLNIKINFHEQDIKEYYASVKSLFSVLSNKNALPQYDYLVIDEAQDIFDRGIDIILNNLLDEEGRGMEYGRALIFYDIDQSYDRDNRGLREYADLLVGPFSHYRLNRIYRSAQNRSIQLLAEKIIDRSGHVQLEEVPGNGYKFKSFNKLEQIKKYIREQIVNTRLNNPQDILVGKDCVLLVESILLNKHPVDGGPGLGFLLDDVKSVHEMTEDNVGLSENVLKYTSILKYKGLEQKYVFLVINDITESNFYQVYVGVTRAIQNLELLILMPS